MKIVLAPDSFKESMGASQAVAAMLAGVNAVMPEAECVKVPMADGGEGTVDVVVDALSGKHVAVDVQGPVGRTVTAKYGFVPHRKLAVIEIAAAAGIELVAPQQRDVLRASTFGVGQLIKSALDRGATEFLVGLGGSATNDGGAGMLTALGAVFTDADGNPLTPGGASLAHLDRIDLTGMDARRSQVPHPGDGRVVPSHRHLIASRRKSPQTRGVLGTFAPRQRTAGARRAADVFEFCLDGVITARLLLS